jgi:hypothetical protein
MNADRIRYGGQDGSIMVVVLLLLALLTIIGISASDTTVTELQIVRNDTQYKKNFYTAEAAAIEAAQMLTNFRDLDQLQDGVPAWMNPSSTYGDFEDTDNWGNGNSAASPVDPSARFTVVDRKIARGASLAMTARRDHEVAVIGLYDSAGSGQVMIEIGVRKKF